MKGPEAGIVCGACRSGIGKSYQTQGSLIAETHLASVEGNLAENVMYQAKKERTSYAMYAHCQLICCNS